MSLIGASFSIPKVDLGYFTPRLWARQHVFGTIFSKHFFIRIRLKI